ncbi:MAG: acyl-CoA dehydrogenase family protein [Frankia sp.]|nr:acyl-CoA dehydrogenase family protein [Frankia sp.]
MRDPLDPDPAAPPFSADHADVRRNIRTWVATNIAPYVDDWESAREFPRELFAAAGGAGLFAHKYTPADGGCGPDLIADAVVTEELARCGSGGAAAALGSQKDLAPYYVARFGTTDQRTRWLRPAITGEAVAALAVTEPQRPCPVSPRPGYPRWAGAPARPVPWVSMTCGCHLTRCSARSTVGSGW